MYELAINQDRVTRAIQYIVKEEIGIHIEPDNIEYRVHRGQRQKVSIVVKIAGKPQPKGDSLVTSESVPQSSAEVSDKDTPVESGEDTKPQPTF
ncbi:MAG: hypothetical protein K0U41_06730 [Gammaproteobacteria bacterium]|nr:hypothetical protein [Gammaproteobacteria bacterium]